ncbi:hypothetical protein M8J77_010717 [Diaphorina citri]|nr:hypothetical protein M8J77_010717 [Diaphorina citri]
MKSINSSVDYNEKLNYTLFTKHLIMFTQLFGSFIMNIKSLKIIKTQLVYNYLTLGLMLFHSYITPRVFISIIYKIDEFSRFSYKDTIYHAVLRVLFPIVVDITAMLSKITVYRMKIYLNTLYNYLYLSDMYINFNKSLPNADNGKPDGGADVLGRKNGWWHSYEKFRKYNFNRRNKITPDDHSSTNSRTNQADDNVISLFRNHHSQISSYAIVALVCLILPANVMRISELIVNSEVSLSEILYFCFMYWENFFVASVELQFFMVCYSIYLRFFEINIMLDNIYNDYHTPMFEHLAGGKIEFHITDDIVIDNVDTTEYKIIQNIPLENINFEYIRISHLFLCEAYVVLNIIFKFQIVFSLGCCFATSLLDLYYEYFGSESQNGTINIKLYCWIIQYFVRFASIVIVAHKTTIESMRTKTLVTSLNNQNIKIEIQEELKLFLRQVESREMGFSAGGLFTLSTPIITSAVAAGITYLVVLIQFHNELVNHEK